MKLLIKKAAIIFIISIAILITKANGEEGFVWKGDFDNQSWFQTWRKKGHFIYLNRKLFKIINELETEPHLEVFHPLGSYSKRNKPGGFHFRFNHFSGTNVTLSYRVKFEEEFLFGKGGKLPGLCGGSANTGKRMPNGEDGFSIRYMWRENGRLYLYCHLPTSIKHGTYFDTGFQLIPNKWHFLKQVVILNDPKLSNGLIIIQLDNQLPVYIKKLKFRKIDGLRIDGIIFSNFFGGSTSTWESPKSQKVFFKSFEVNNHMSITP